MDFTKRELALMMAALDARERSLLNDNFNNPEEATREASQCARLSRRFGHEAAERECSASADAAEQNE